ncbi:transglycosylase SLT domain-containing protein, partial [Bacillus sp. mrc49]|uniref:transglycosylase SLT domain-containing protein n=1 Tax=Bacillus sp. mrc49 TaxID=2054913 RepID=UPI000CB95CF0
NGAIGGVNWILKKIGTDKKLDTWNAPRFARGTGKDGHKGGLAYVGDGGEKELVRLPNGKTFLSPATDTLLNLPRGTHVFSGSQTKAILNGQIPAFKGGTISNLFKSSKNLLSKGTSAVKNAVGDVWDWMDKPAELLKTTLNKHVNLDSIKGLPLDLAKGAVNMVKDNGVSYIKKMFDFGIGDMGDIGGGGANKAKQWILKAMSITNTPSSYLKGLMLIAKRESGYNPKAINLWDSNAKAGHPSRGLFQTIPTTFAAHKKAGMDNIYNPIHNAVAAIRYMISRYGSIGNVPGL